MTTTASTKTEETMDSIAEAVAEFVGDVIDENSEQEAGTEDLPGIHYTSLGFGGVDIGTDKPIALDQKLRLLIEVRVTKTSRKRAKNGDLQRSASGPVTVLRQLTANTTEEILEMTEI